MTTPDLPLPATAPAVACVRCTVRGLIPLGAALGAELGAVAGVVLGGDVGLLLGDRPGVVPAPRIAAAGRATASLPVLFSPLVTMREPPTGRGVPR